MSRKNSKTAAAGSAPRPRILLVEDNPGDTRLVLEALNEKCLDLPGFDLDSVGTLEKAFGRIGREHIDLVLLDLSLPDAQGLSTIRRFHTFAPDIPVIVLTGTNDEETAIEALHTGAQDYIVKDEIQARSLRRSIRYALERASERKKFESQLVQSQKMEALGRLAGGVAHDFNNLLTIIVGHAELLMSDFPKDSPARQNMVPIVKAAHRAASLTRQLLAFSRKQVIRPQILDVGSIIIEVGKMLRRLVNENIEIRVDVEPGLGNVNADPTQIEQVIMNLAVNARDAMPSGGTLTINASNTLVDSSSNQWSVKVVPGEYILLTVTDTGAGMDETTRQRIFEPFFTTKDLGQGTGLGLAMVYGIVKQAGGYIWVYSEPGHGTTFKIYLPRVSGTVPSGAKISSLRQPRRGSETILVVEDESQLRALVDGILTGWGYKVLIAGDGLEALDVCDKYNGEIHLIITDMVMPRMGGRDVVDRVHEIRPETRFLYISGYPGDAAFQNGVSGDTTLYLQKPFAPSQLSDMLWKIFN